MLDLLKESLNKKGVFNGDLPPILKQIVDAIPNQEIPYRMKLALAVSELTVFTSHLRRNIAHWNGSYIPVNAITFIIAGSGDGKDSSVNAARKCFKTGYEIIDSKRKEKAKGNAIRLAMADGKPDAEQWDVYKDYYFPPNPLFVAPSTVEGMYQHFNDLDSSSIGAGYTQSGEFGAELVSGGLIIENIKLLSEIYDEGNKEVKVLKSRENQSKELKNFPFSALYMGSQDNILYDESVKKIFRREFGTKLARRSNFMFAIEKIDPIDYTLEDDPIAAMLADERRIEELAVQSRYDVDKQIDKLTRESIQNVGKPIVVSDEVQDLFNEYKRYNKELSDTISSQFTISKLVRKHLQWKALKLAGAIAIFSNHSSILKQDYISAISYVEMLDEDMMKFEQELVKEPYEVFVDYMHEIAEDGKSALGLHALRKRGYIAMTGTPANKMKELVQLATAYDKTGIYTACEEGICYEAIQLTDIAGVSYKSVDNSGVARAVANKEGKQSIKDEKQKVAKTAVDEYEFFETDFTDLGTMLLEDFAYSPFQFKDGIRGADNIIGGCKWVCLDIDASSITDEEAHFMLQDINHHIARTSDPDNEFKFRVLVELDGIVDIPGAQWNKFIKSIGDTLSLNVDLLAKSQLYFSFKDRNVLSVTDAEPLVSKPHAVVATTAEAEAKAKQPTTAEVKAMLNDELSTFSFAFNAQHGERSRSLIRAAKWAFNDLGMSTSETCDLMHRISDYWDVPFDETRMENTIISQIKRW